MTISTRIALGVSAAVLSLGLALAPAAFAQDKMGKEEGMATQLIECSWAAGLVLSIECRLLDGVCSAFGVRLE